MGWQFTPYSVIAFIGATVSIAIAIVAWKRRPARGAASFTALSLSVAIWALGNAFQLFSGTDDIRNAWYRFQWLGMVAACTALLCFALQFSGQDSWLTWPLYLTLAIEPLVTILLVLTNPAHHWMWTAAPVAPTYAAPAQWGPWFWINRAYTFSIVLASLFLLFRTYVRSPRLYRLQLLPLLIGVLVPTLTEVMMTLGPPAVRSVDLTSFAAVVGLLLSARGFVGTKFLDIVPAAHGAVIESMPDGVIVLDHRLRVVDINPAAQDILQLEASRAVGQPARSVFGSSPELAQRCHASARDHAEVPFDSEEGQRVFDVRISPLSDRRKRFSGRVLVLHEITELKLVEKALRESEERYALAARGANDGLWDWSLIDDKIYFSPRWKTMLGYEEDDIGDQPREWFDRVHPLDALELRRMIDAHLEGSIPHFENEHRIRRKDQSYLWVLSRGLAHRDEKGNAYRMAGSLTDISERKRSEERLRHDALHDSLTGLPNREFLMDRLAMAVERSKRRKSFMFAVLFLDLDRFKVVNDSLGHWVGDQFLVAVAKRLGSCVRQMDTFARLGGDEFVILMEDIHGANDATSVADRIQQELQASFQLYEHEIFTSASIGIALSPSDGEAAEELLRNADIAMYRAKELGRARYVLYDQEMHAYAMMMLEMEAQLRRAIEREEFVLYYQPIVALKSQAVTGFEALLRWRHPTRGLLPPSEFMPVAEDTELILPIGQWVLRKACSQLAEWHKSFPKRPPITVGVNVGSRQLRDPALSSYVVRALAETGIQPDSLVLEITESLVMQDTEVATGILRQLKSTGVRLHIDDFGSSYSALNVLHEFPIDTLKIDRSLVSGMSSNPGNREIVRSIITLGHDLSKHVVAEGIETPEDLAQLRTIHCEYGQGYYFAQAMDSAEATLLIQETQLRGDRRRSRSRG